MTPRASLRAVKSLHTVVWAYFAGCILLVPVYAWRGDLRAAAVSIGIVSVEVAVILVNRWRCPLTSVAARYTEDRKDNFDIYLPLWLARYNEVLFGTLFLLGILYTLARRRGWVH